MWEAFLLQMNDFDRLLEFKLRQLLDPVVSERPPARPRRKGRAEAVVAMPVAPVELVPQAIPVIAASHTQS